MNKMIYAMGYVDGSGNVILKGAYRENDIDNVIFVTVGKDNISADVIRTEAGTTELPTDMIMDICERHECGSCPLDDYNRPYEDFDDAE